MLMIRRNCWKYLQFLKLSRLTYSSKGSKSDEPSDSYPSTGNLPGGGLGKLQSTREEVYFCKQQNELIMKLFKKYQNPEKVSMMSYEEKAAEKKVLDEYFNVCIYGSSSKNVDVKEEGYFHNEQMELINRLRSQEEISAKKAPEPVMKDPWEN